MMNWLHVLLAYPMMVMMVIAVALALHVRVCACVAIWDISWIAPRTWGWRRGLGAARPPVGQCTRPTSSQFRPAAPPSTVPPRIYTSTPVAAVSYGRVTHRAKGEIPAFLWYRRHYREAI